jgi:hypothetical protein
VRYLRVLPYVLLIADVIALFKPEVPLKSKKGEGDGTVAFSIRIVWKVVLASFSCIHLLKAGGVRQ